MYNTSDIRRGLKVEMRGKPFVILDFQHVKPFHNVIVAFSEPLVALIYMVANFLLAVHLYHGVWSFFQTMGWDHPTHGPWRRRFAMLMSGVIGAANISIPLAVLTGVVHL